MAEGLPGGSLVRRRLGRPVVNADLALARDADVVRNLIAYDDAKRAFLVAKKMAQADLAKVAKEGFLTTAEDGMMRASVAVAEHHLSELRKLLGT